MSSVARGGLRHWTAVGCLLGTLGCDATNTETAKPVADPRGCTWQLPERTGQVAVTELTELSGLAASLRHPGYLWAHNDAGNDPDVFLLQPDGTLRARWRLQDTGDKSSRDWEDSAVGPCRAGAAETCLWLGDIGDNDAARASVRILRWTEPATLPAATTTGKVGPGALGGWQAVQFSYPEGPQDAEALAALPDGRLIVATKRNDGRTRLYRVDAATALDAGQSTAQVTLLGTLNLTKLGDPAGEASRVTAASLSGDGGMLALRSKRAIWLWQDTTALLDEAASAGAAIDNWQGLALPSPVEAQGEALSWDSEGALWTSSEGKLPPIHRLRCVAP